MRCAQNGNSMHREPRRIRIEQRDILLEIDEAMHAKRPGTANSDVNVFALPVEVTYGLLNRIVDEIKRLRENAK